MTLEQLKRWAARSGWLLLSEVTTDVVATLQFLLPDGQVRELDCYSSDKQVSVRRDKS